MKFLCPSCKAKYQIADEKVAGRSVRMKCRKCGHVIQVSSADAIAGSSLPPPGGPEDLGELDGPSPSAAEAPPAPAQRAAPGRAQPAAAPAVEPMPAQLGRPQPAVRPGAKTLPFSGAASRPAAPSTAKGAANARAAGGTLGSSPAATEDGTAAGKGRAAPPPKPSVARPTPEKKAPATRSLVAKPTIAASSPRPGGAGLAAGTKPAPTATAAAHPTPAASAATAPSPPSNGFEEEGEEEQTRIASPSALTGALSAAIHEHVPASVTDPLSMPGDEWFVGINGVPVGPIRLAELRAKATSGAITRESLVWRDGFEEWRPLKSFPELVAVVEEGLSSTRAATAPFQAAAGALGDPFAATALAAGATSTPGGVVTTTAVVTDDLAAAGLRRRTATSPAAWIAMVVAVLFGITLGFVFFGRPGKPAEKTEKVAEAPATASATPPPAAAQAGETKPEETVVAADPKATVKGPSSSTTKVASKPAEPDSKLTGGLKGLGLSGLSAAGPKGPSDEVSRPSSGASQLEASQVQGVVARYTPSVKRTCWQPALDTRAKDAPTSARVSVAITVGPSGSVQDVSATNGDPRGYPGLANCIVGRVRGWQFPPGSGQTTVNVPFVFVAQ